MIFVTFFYIPLQKKYAHEHKISLLFAIDSCYIDAILLELFFTGTE